MNKPQYVFYLCIVVYSYANYIKLMLEAQRVNGVHAKEQFICSNKLAIRAEFWIFGYMNNEN